MSPKKNPFRRLDKQLVFILFITYSCYSYDVQPCLIYMILILPRHCLIYDPDSSPSLSYIWFWFFPITILYMILILPRHCLIYHPDSSPSVPNNTDLKNNWNLSFIQYFFLLPFMGHLYIVWQFSPYGEQSGYS